MSIQRGKHKRWKERWESVWTQAGGNGSGRGAGSIAGSIMLWMKDPGMSDGKRGHTQDRTEAALSPKGMLTCSSPGRAEINTGLKEKLCFGSYSSGSDQRAGFCLSLHRANCREAHLCPPTNTLQVASGMVLKMPGFSKGRWGERKEG